MKHFVVPAVVLGVLTPNLQAQTPPPSRGQLSNVAGTCVVVRGNPPSTLQAMQNMEVLPGDSIYCSKASGAKVELPGTRREITVGESQSYLVMSPPRYPTPANSMEKGGPGGRVSGAQPTQLEATPVGGQTSHRVAASGARSSGVLETCASPLGTVSLIENSSANWQQVLTNDLKLPPASTVLRQMIQQSNCFVVVDRGTAGQQAMHRERVLMQSGEMHRGSNMARGQSVATDFGIVPEVVFPNTSAGLGAAISALSGRPGGSKAGLAGAALSRETSTTLTLFDNRSSTEMGVYEGSPGKLDPSALTSMSGSATNAYLRTAEGRIISAAFLDAFNQMVVLAREHTPQKQRMPEPSDGQR